MSKFLKRSCARLLILLFAGSLVSCAGTPPAGETAPQPSGGIAATPNATAPGVTPTPSPLPEPTPTPTPADTYEAITGYWSPDKLTQAWGKNQVVEHLFFHPTISYPEVAFATADAAGLDDWMVTVDEYDKILQNLYDKDYILVNMGDVWSEYTNEAGETRMQRNVLQLPEGKKPLIISYDDVNYYPYMLEEGFTYKLILGDDGELWSYGVDPTTGKDVVSQDLDAVTILDKFVRAHPDFSLNGAKGCLSLTGYYGILGYRTQADHTAADPVAYEKQRQLEIEGVQPIVARLKATGWTFGSHTWGHIRLSNKSMEVIQTDTQRWADEVGSLVGPTNILFYPHGARPDGDHDQGKTVGQQFQYLQSMGFRIFASVGSESYSQIKSTTSAVICDRLHPDGTTLRWKRDRYLQFYDAWEIINLDVRPNLPYDRNDPGK